MLALEWFAPIPKSWADKLENGLRTALKRGTCSFHGDTQVLTSAGYRDIRDIRPGHRVWSRDEFTGATSYRSVLAQYSNPYMAIVHVTVENLQTGGRHTIKSNRIHPFFAVPPQGEARLQLTSSEGHDYRGPIKGGAWIDAQNLELGFRLMSGDENWSEVVDVRIEDKQLTAYNLTVAQFHTYFVRGAANDNAQPVWVHNNCWLLIHNNYVKKYFPNAREKSFNWIDPNGPKNALGTRKLDHYDAKTGVGYEFNTTPWAIMTQEKLDAKLVQVSADWALVKSGQLKSVTWYGTEALPSTGRGAQLANSLAAAGITYIVRPR